MRASAVVTNEFDFVSEIFSLTKRHPTPTMAAKAVCTNLILMWVIYFLQLLRLRSLLEGRHIASPPPCRTCSYQPCRQAQTVG